MCHGRLEDGNFDLFDNDKVKYFGKDYFNIRIKDFRELSNHEKDLFNRKKFPRMPWKDTGVFVFGTVVKLLS